MTARTRPHRSASERTTEALLAMIEDRRLAPGDRLPVERQLSSDLGVSRSTVREAIRALTSAGMLTARQGSGTYVTDLSADRLAAPLRTAIARTPASASELAEIRGILEIGATRLAAERATPRDLARLRRLASKADASGTPAACNATDGAFRRAVVDVAGNPVLGAIIASIEQLTTDMPASAKSAPRNPTPRLHAAIVAGIAARDPDAAAAAMREHITAG